MRARQETVRALLIAGVAACAIAAPVANIYVVPAAAQAVSLSVDFRTALEPYGAWQHHRRWGEVWIPSRVARDWQPYTVGHWVYSQDYGWYWASDDEEADWGLVAYHYGRWVMDDQFGWMWIPGTEWGPGWVQWRHGRQHVGWAPLPPDEVIVEYREAPQFWVFVRERDLVAPRVTEVILPLREREVFFRDTVVVNRTVVLEDRRFGVNPGIPPTYIAAAYGRPIPSYDISPRVFAGTANLPGATVVRAEDFRNRERVREITRQSTFIRQTTSTVAPARDLPPLQPLGANERGRLGALPPRAAQPNAAVTGQNRPEGSNAPTTPGSEPRAGQSPNRPAPSRQGAAPGQPLQQEGRGGRPAAPGARGPAPTTGVAPGAQRNEGRGDVRGAQPERDQRGLREGGPGAPSPNAPGTFGEGRRGPQAGAPGPNTNQRNPREGRPAVPNAPGAAPTTGVAPGSQRDDRRGDVRGAQPERDQRGLREGGPGAPPPNAPGTFGEGRRGPQAGAPSTSGAAPSSRERGGERELRNRPPQAAVPPQDLRGRERSGIESQSPRNQSPRNESIGGERGAAQRPAPGAPSQRPSAVERAASPGVQAPPSRAPAAEMRRPQSPATTGAAPGGGRAAPGGGGRREEQR